jgi:hypothetical protein
MMLVPTSIGATMPHSFDEFPPYEVGGETIVEDVELSRECDREFSILKRDQGGDIDLVKSITSFNPKFGPVCRLDFLTPEDSKEAVNRLMLWRLGSGRFAKFVGFNVPTAPLGGGVKVKRNTLLP